MGRVTHGRVGDQAGIVDQPRLEAALKRYELVPAQMEPGDVLFFHCNLWHTSDKNDSDMRRYAIITAVNKRSNDPIFQHHHPNYHPLNMVDNSGERKLAKRKTLRWYKRTNRIFQKF